MTWAERFGDLFTQIALVFINLARVFTGLGRIGATALDGFITALAERSEEGIRPSDTPRNAWTRYLAAVAWGIAAVALRLLAIVTTFLRQATVTADEFLRELAEGPTTQATQ